jgi:hypothetical protein
MSICRNSLMEKQEVWQCPQSIPPLLRTRRHPAWPMSARRDQAAAGRRNWGGAGDPGLPR